MHTVWNKKTCFIELLVSLHIIVYSRTTNKCSFLKDMQMSYCNVFVARSLLTQLQIIPPSKVLIPQSASVSIIGCSMEDVIVPEGPSKKHNPTCVISIQSVFWHIYSNDTFNFQNLLNCSGHILPRIVVHKKRRTHLGKDNFLKIAIYNSKPLSKR